MNPSDTFSLPHFPGLDFGLGETIDMLRESVRSFASAEIAPRDLHRSRAARLDGVTAGAEPDLTRTVVLLDPRQAKGLEFDSVLVVEPGRYGTSDLYVALTRATQRLGVLHTGELPASLAQAFG